MSEPTALDRVLAEHHPNCERRNGELSGVYNCTCGCDEAERDLAILHDTLADKRDENQQLNAELEALRAESAARRIALEELRTAQAQEVDEFNAGFEAYKADMDLDDAEITYRNILPENVPSYDVFSSGYAWAKFVVEREAALAAGRREGQ